MKRVSILILFNAAATVALMSLLEVCSRLLHPVEPPAPVFTHKKYFVPDPLLFWVARPNIVEGGKPNGEPVTNSLGLRGPDIPAKAPDEFRILSLGESTTFGLYVSHRNTYSSLLEDQLESVAGRTVRVINAGMPGYTLFQGVTYLEHRGLALEPDAVLTYFGYNDFLPAAKRAPAENGETRSDDSKQTLRALTDREIFDRRQTSAYRIHYLLEKYSNLFRFISLHRLSERAVEVDRNVLRVPGRDRRQLLTKLRSISLSHGLRLVVVIPWYGNFRRHVELLREFCAENAVPVVDLPKILRMPAAERKEYFIDRVHPNMEGHRLIARAIAKRLRLIWGERGWPGPD
jgi:lysophospholipase L1-like esterase